MQPDLSTTPRFAIVMPVYNGAGYIDEAIASIFSQAGPFLLRVHVQDGASSDGTLDRIRAWEERLQSPLFPRFCLGIDFTYASAPDKGMYDALQTGFDAISILPCDFAAWLNSDDYFLPGSLRFVLDRLTQFPDVDWLASRPSESDSGGVMRRIHDPQLYPGATLRAGLHDGRRLPFVMQEGSFWRGRLWLQSGGLRTDLRLAGDFDLWRRFARFATLHSTEILLAVHRRRPNQLSASSEEYYAEVDEILMTPGEVILREQVWADYQKWRNREPGTEFDFSAAIIVFQSVDMPWTIEWRQTLALQPPLLAKPGAEPISSIGARYLEGFTAPEGPYVHVNLLKGFRFAQPGINRFQLDAPERTVYSIIVRFRNFHGGMNLELSCRGSRLFSMQAPITNHDRNGHILTDWALQRGVSQFELQVDGTGDAAGQNLLILGIEAVPVSCTY